MANRYNRPAEQPIMNTYVPLPYQELFQAGQAKQKRQDEANAKALEFAGKQFNFLTQDFEGAAAAMKEIESGAEELSNMDLTSREGRRKLNEYINTSKKRFGKLGDIGAYEASYNSRSEYKKQLDEGVAKKRISAERATALLREADASYKGIGEYNPTSGYTSYSGQRAADDYNYTEWVQKHLSDLEAVTGAYATASPDGNGYIWKSKGTNEVVSADRILEAANQLAKGDEGLIYNIAEGERLGFKSTEAFKAAVMGAKTKYAYSKQSADKSVSSDSTWGKKMDWAREDEKNKPKTPITGTDIAQSKGLDPDELLRDFDRGPGAYARGYDEKVVKTNEQAYVQAQEDYASKLTAYERAQETFNSTGKLPGFSSSEAAITKLQQMKAELDASNDNLYEAQSSFEEAARIKQESLRFGVDNNEYFGSMEEYNQAQSRAAELREKQDRYEKYNSEAQKASAGQPFKYLNEDGSKPTPLSFTEKMELGAISANTKQVEENMDRAIVENMSNTMAPTMTLYTDKQKKEMEDMGVIDYLKSSPEAVGGHLFRFDKDSKNTNRKVVADKSAKESIKNAKSIEMVGATDGQSKFLVTSEDKDAWGNKITKTEEMYLDHDAPGFKQFLLEGTFKDAVNGVQKNSAGVPTNYYLNKESVNFENALDVLNPGFSKMVSTKLTKAKPNSTVEIEITDNRNVVTMSEINSTPTLRKIYDEAGPESQEFQRAINDYSLNREKQQVIYVHNLDNGQYALEVLPKGEKPSTIGGAMIGDLEPMPLTETMEKIKAINAVTQGHVIQ